MSDHQDAYYHNQKNIKTMRYLLQERFVGAYLGGVMAERLSPQTKTSLNKLDHNQIFWLEIHQEIMTQIPLDLSQSLSWEDLHINARSKITISELALILVPLILYYHDNLPQLEFFLAQNAQYWQIPTSDLAGIIWWSTAVSLTLRDKLNPEDLLSQLTFAAQRLDYSFGQDLVRLQSLFTKLLSVTEVAEELLLLANPQDLPFLLSLYCFYQTPENFALTLQQARRVQDLTCNLLALTGFLSGAYNSRIGLPVDWEKFWQNEDSYQKIWQLGRKNFALWSGVCDRGNDVNMTAIVATPRSLQNRVQLKIISQTEYESNYSQDITALKNIQR